MTTVAHSNRRRNNRTAREVRRPTILGPDALTVTEAAQEMGKGVSTIWRWVLGGIRGHKLNSTLVGGQRWIRRADLTAFIAESNARRAA